MGTARHTSTWADSGSDRSRAACGSWPRDLRLGTFDWHHKGKHILHFVDGQQTRHGYVNDLFKPYDGEPYPLSTEQWRDYDDLKRAYEEFASQIRPDQPWAWSQAQERDQQTLKDWIATAARTTFGKWTIAVLARIGGSGAFEPGDTSALHYF